MPKTKALLKNRLYLIITLWLFLLSSGCGELSNRQTAGAGSVSADGSFSTPLPKQLQKHRAGVTAEVEAIHEEGAVRTAELVIDDAHQATVTLPNLVVGSYTFTISYRINGLLVLFETSKETIRENETTAVTIFSRTFPDDDEDGITNLDEIDNGTDPIDPEDPPQLISINDVSVSEAGVTGTFTVSLSKTDTQVVTVIFSTENDTAMAGEDYTSTSLTLTFDPGVTEQIIEVPILQDSIDEPSETFNVILGSPVNATLADGVGIGTIVDDDGLPDITINNVSRCEQSGPASFTVKLSNPSSETVTVVYNTNDGSAIGPGTCPPGLLCFFFFDYTPTSGTLTFSPGTTEKKIIVPITNDTINEKTEKFSVLLENPINAEIQAGQGTGTGTILNDDTGDEPIPSRCGGGFIFIPPTPPVAEIVPLF